MPLLADPQAHRLLRRLPGAVRHRHRAGEGRDHRHHRRQRGRQVDLPEGDRRPHSRRRRQRAARRRADRRAAAADIVKLGIALVPEGRRLFPSLTVEENLLIGGYGRKIAGPWTLDRVYALFPMLRERRAAADADPVRRPAADGRDRPRPDVQPARALVRRDQPRPRADRHPRHLRGAAADQGGGHQRRAGRAGHRPGDEGRRSRLLLPGRPAVARPAARAS